MPFAADRPSPSSEPAFGPETTRRRDLILDGPVKVMGIVNVTPDSFSDGGRFLAPEQAVEHALRLVSEGAEILDLGAESTRPGGGVYGAGCDEVSVDEELRRLLPVLEALRRQVPETLISVDTRKGAVARRVLQAGADLINDVGGLADPELVDAVSEAGCPVVVMHSRGELATMQKDVVYDDVVRDVPAELEVRIRAAFERGLCAKQVIVDPGIGFAKTAQHNFQLLAGLDHLAALGYPILLGASRKSFIGSLDGSTPDSRLGGSLATALWGSSQGVSILRVHDVLETVQLLKVWNAIHLSREAARGDASGPNEDGN